MTSSEHMARVKIDELRELEEGVPIVYKAVQNLVKAASPDAKKELEQFITPLEQMSNSIGNGQELDQNTVHDANLALVGLLFECCGDNLVQPDSKHVAYNLRRLTNLNGYSGQ